MVGIELLVEVLSRKRLAALGCRLVTPRRPRSPFRPTSSARCGSRRSGSPSRSSAPRVRPAVQAEREVDQRSEIDTLKLQLTRRSHFGRDPLTSDRCFRNHCASLNHLRSYPTGRYPLWTSVQSHGADSRQTLCSMLALRVGSGRISIRSSARHRLL
jgi:hypothetical protein